MKRTMSLVVVAAALASQGCSLLLSRSPEPMALTGVPCNTSSAPAWLDVSQATGSVLAALAFSDADEDAPSGVGDGFASIMVGSLLVQGIVYGASAAYGFSQVNACKRLRTAEMAQLRRPAPPPSEWRTPSVPAGEDEPPFDVEVHTDVIVRPRR